MDEIRPIETEYNGYRFRSRLEARWAVFFDALGVDYEYEPEGFEMDDGTRYLPDFYLPNIDGGVYVEVKGLMDDDDRRKMETFCKHSDTPLYVVGGIPTQDDLDCNDIYSYAERYEECFWYRRGKFGDWPYLFCVCPACGKVGIEFDGRGWRVCGDHHADKNLDAETYKDDKGVTRRFVHPEVKGWRTDDKGYSWNQERIVNSYKVARQARFEHGETPDASEVRRLAHA